MNSFRRAPVEPPRSHAAGPNSKSRPRNSTLECLCYGNGLSQPHNPGARTSDVGRPAASGVSPVARLALALTAWTERWVPDAFIFALVATFLVFVAALVATPAAVTQVVDAWGRGFWDLIPFTLQMALVIITGHVLATSPPLGAFIRAIASRPRTPRGAVALVTFSRSRARG